MNRDQIQAQYIQWDLDQMSVADLKQYFVDSQNRELNDLDDDELFEDVKQYCPQLFEQIVSYLQIVLLV